MKRAIIAMALAFFVTLAVVVGSRLDAEALAVVVGIVASIAAGVPTSILLLVVLARRDRAPDEGVGYRARSYPPVVVIQGDQASPLPYQPPFPASTVRHHDDALEVEGAYRVLGDE